MRKPSSHLWRDFANGVLIAVALILLKGAIENWQFGKQIEQMTYQLLQLHLLSRVHSGDLPVAIVDISGLTPVPTEYGGKKLLVTPREPLRKLIEAIALQRPRAIGIDLNFSPGPFGYITAADPALLLYFLDLGSQGVPVYVGVFDSVVLTPEHWLGRPEFRALAAYISVPNPEEQAEPSSRMLEWVHPAGVREACPSLSYALARSESKGIPTPLRWAVRRTTVKQEEEFSTSEFLVDYSPVDKLISSRIVADSAEDLAGQKAQLAGKIVLMGRASPGQTADQFNVPGRGMPAPGIYLHAAAVYTLLQAPLYRLTHAGRIAADALAALSVFGTILLVGLYANRRSRGGIGHRLQGALIAVVILMVLLVGQFLVHRIRLIWTDYLMVIGALLVHGPLERSMGSSLGWFRNTWPARWTRAALGTITSKRKARGKHEKSD